MLYNKSRAYWTKSSCIPLTHVLVLIYLYNRRVEFIRSRYEKYLGGTLLVDSLFSRVLLYCTDSSQCVCVVIPFILDVIRLVDAPPAGVTQEEGRTGSLQYGQSIPVLHSTRCNSALLRRADGAPGMA